MLRTIYALLLFTGILACQDGSNFLSGQAGKNEEPSEPKASDGLAENTTVEEISAGIEEELFLPEKIELTELAEDEQNALNECLASWPDHPFTAEQIKKPTTFVVNKNIGNSQLIFKDSQKSPAPHLKLLILDIRIGNQGRMELLDQNAWTCVYFKGKVLNNFSIHQICDSQLALISFDSQVANNFTINDVCP